MSVSNTRVISLSYRPHFAISAMVILSLANITVLGPVPAGIIKENEAAIVAGIIRSRGFVLPATAKLARTGKKIFAVAVFELTSVKNIIKLITIIRTIKEG